MPIVFIDLETTGLDPQTDKILEVACIVTDDDLNEIARFQRVTDQARVTNFEKVDAFVRKMHSDNGLWVDSINAKSGERFSGGPEITTVDSELGAFISEHATRIAAKDGTQFHVSESGIVLRAWAKSGDELVVKDGTVAMPDGSLVAPRPWGSSDYRPVLAPLAGNSVGFDRGFINAQMLATSRALHYRTIDVSSFTELARRVWPAIYEDRPNAKGPIAHRAMPDIEHSLETLRYYASQLGVKAVAA